MPPEASGPAQDDPTSQTASTGSGPVPGTRLRRTGTYGTGDGASSRPQQMQPRYLRSRMTYVYVSIEELAMLAASGGIGSFATSAAVFLVGQSFRPDIPEPAQKVLFGSAVVIGALMLASYVTFFGLVGRIRGRNSLSWWLILSDEVKPAKEQEDASDQAPQS